MGRPSVPSSSFAGMPPIVTNPPVGTAPALGAAIAGLAMAVGGGVIRIEPIIAKPNDIISPERLPIPLRHATMMLITPTAVRMPGRPEAGGGGEYANGAKGSGGG